LKVRLTLPVWLLESAMAYESTKATLQSYVVSANQKTHNTDQSKHDLAGGQGLPNR
jgi:hypothetical protein